jgi:ribosome recycling factor
MNLDEAKIKMQKALQILQDDLATVRTGRAAPSLIENVVINAYQGTQKLKIKELATIATSDSQTLVLTPFDPSILDEMQKGIMESNIGLTPSSDGHVIRISIPPLSEERRKDLIRVMKQKLENGKITIRQIRQDARNDLKKSHEAKEVSDEQLRKIEDDIQKITDDNIEQIDETGRKKEEELLQI